MTHRLMSQFPLSATSPTDPAGKHAKVTFIVTLAANGSQIALVMEQEGSGKDYIAIKEHSVVKIALRGSQLFFSKTHQAITMKDGDVSHFYGALQYCDYEEEYDRYKGVQFVARFNEGGQYGTKHPFNVNVDLLQDGGEAPSWIGLTIDPDIVNPPPTRN